MTIKSGQLSTEMELTDGNSNQHEIIVKFDFHGYHSVATDSEPVEWPDVDIVSVFLQFRGKLRELKSFVKYSANIISHIYEEYEKGD